MITLPKEWGNSVGLKKNDSVGLQAQPDGSLTLYPTGSAPEIKRTTKVIDATNIKTRGFLYRQLVGAYIAGHMTIVVTSDPPMPSVVTTASSSFVQTAIGLETIEADDSHILISDLMEQSAVNTKKIVEKMRLLVKGMIHDMYDAAFTGDVDSLRDMNFRYAEINRVHGLIARQCNIAMKDATASRKMNVPLYELSSCLSLSRVLVSIGNHAISTSNYLVLISDVGDLRRVDECIYKTGEGISEILTNSIESWINKDIVLAEQMISDIDGVISSINDKVVSNIKAHNASEYVREIVLFSSKRIMENCRIITELAFNRAMD
jgi:phosphate uptake regulator